MDGVPAAPDVPAAPAARAVPLVAGPVGVRRKDPVTGVVYDDGEAADGEPPAKRASHLDRYEFLLEPKEHVKMGNVIHDAQIAAAVLYAILQDAHERVEAHVTDADGARGVALRTKRAFYAAQLEDLRGQIDQHINRISSSERLVPFMMRTALEAGRAQDLLVRLNGDADLAAVVVDDLVADANKIVPVIQRNVNRIVDRASSS